MSSIYILIYSLNNSHRKNPHHTVPTLEVADVDGRTTIETDSIQVCKLLDKISGNPLLETSENAEAIDTFVKEMHDNADVGNPLLFTSRDEAELAEKKDMIVPFLEGRVQGWQKYAQQAPEYKDLYDQNIKSTQAMIAQYKGEADPKPMFDTNARLWNMAVAFLDKTEKLLKESKGDYIFGDYSLADVHLTAWLYRQVLVRGDENFEGRPSVKAYYERVKARPSFNATWGQ